MPRQEAVFLPGHRFGSEPERCFAINLGVCHGGRLGGTPPPLPVRPNVCLRAAVGRTKGNLVEVNLLANTDLRSTDDFEKLIVVERNDLEDFIAAIQARLRRSPPRGDKRDA